MTKLLRYKKMIVVLTIFIVLFILMVLFKDTLLKMLYPKQHTELVKTYCQMYQVEENLVYAVMKAESNFDESVISNKGAVGLMQLMEKTAEDVANKHNIQINKKDMQQDLLKPEYNIQIGTKYLQMMLEKYGNKEVALAAYNAGTGTVDNWIEKGIINSDGSNIEYIPYKETNNYVRKILRDYKIYEKLYTNLMM